MYSYGTIIKNIHSNCVLKSYSKLQNFCFTTANTLSEFSAFPIVGLTIKYFNASG